MPNELVTVFGASGRQGMAQVVKLKEAGYRVRAVARNPKPYTKKAFEGCQVVAADYDDEDSVTEAMRGTDFVFFNLPAFAGAGHKLDIVKNVCKIAAWTGVQRIVINPSAYMPEPDKPVGQMGYDGSLLMEKAVQASGARYTIIAPVLFMDNLLTDWAKPFIVKDGIYTYPQEPTLEANWICLDDVGMIMIEAMKRKDLENQRVVVGGPETLRPTDVAQILSETLGRPIKYQMMPIRAFAEILYGLFREVSDVPQEAYVEALTDFYKFNNYSPVKPFKVDMQKVHNVFPMKLTTMREWAKKQDWSLQADRPSGG